MDSVTSVNMETNGVYDAEDFTLKGDEKDEKARENDTVEESKEEREKREKKEKQMDERGRKRERRTVRDVKKKVTDRDVEEAVQTLRESSASRRSRSLTCHSRKSEPSPSRPQRYYDWNTTHFFPDVVDIDEGGVPFRYPRRYSYGSPISDRSRKYVEEEWVQDLYRYDQLDMQNILNNLSKGSDGLIKPQASAESTAVMNTEIQRSPVSTDSSSGEESPKMWTKSPLHVKKKKKDDSRNILDDSDDEDTGNNTVSGGTPRNLLDKKERFDALHKKYRGANDSNSTSGSSVLQQRAEERQKFIEQRRNVISSTSPPPVPLPEMPLSPPSRPADNDPIRFIDDSDAEDTGPGQDSGPPVKPPRMQHDVCSTEEFKRAQDEYHFQQLTRFQISEIYRNISSSFENIYDEADLSVNVSRMNEVELYEHQRRKQALEQSKRQVELLVNGLVSAQTEAALVSVSPPLVHQPNQPSNETMTHPKSWYVPSENMEVETTVEEPKLDAKKLMEEESRKYQDYKREYVRRISENSASSEEKLEQSLSPRVEKSIPPDDYEYVLHKIHHEHHEAEYSQPPMTLTYVTQEMSPRLPRASDPAGFSSSEDSAFSPVRPSKKNGPAFVDPRPNLDQSFSSDDSRRYVSDKSDESSKLDQKGSKVARTAEIFAKQNSSFMPNEFQHTSVLGDLKNGYQQQQLRTDEMRDKNKCLSKDGSFDESKNPDYAGQPEMELFLYVQRDELTPAHSQDARHSTEQPMSQPSTQLPVSASQPNQTKLSRNDVAPRGHQTESNQPSWPQERSTDPRLDAHGGHPLYGPWRSMPEIAKEKELAEQQRVYDPREVSRGHPHMNYPHASLPHDQAPNIHYSKATNGPDPRERVPDYFQQTARARPDVKGGFNGPRQPKAQNRGQDPRRVADPRMYDPRFIDMMKRHHAKLLEQERRERAKRQAIIEATEKQRSGKPSINAPAANVGPQQQEQYRMSYQERPKAPVEIVVNEDKRKPQYITDTGQYKELTRPSSKMTYLTEELMENFDYMRQRQQKNGSSLTSLSSIMNQREEKQRDTLPTSVQSNIAQKSIDANGNLPRPSSQSDNNRGDSFKSIVAPAPSKSDHSPAHRQKNANHYHFANEENKDKAVEPDTKMPSQGSFIPYSLGREQAQHQFLQHQTPDGQNFQNRISAEQHLMDRPHPHYQSHDHPQFGKSAPLIHDQGNRSHLLDSRIAAMKPADPRLVKHGSPQMGVIRPMDQRPGPNRRTDHEMYLPQRQQHPMGMSDRPLHPADASRRPEAYEQQELRMAVNKSQQPRGKFDPRLSPRSGSSHSRSQQASLKKSKKKKSVSPKRDDPRARSPEEKKHRDVSKDTAMSFNRQRDMHYYRASPDQIPGRLPRPLHGQAQEWPPLKPSAAITPQMAPRLSQSLPRGYPVPHPQVRSISPLVDGRYLLENEQMNRPSRPSSHPSRGEPLPRSDGIRHPPHQDDWKKTMETSSKPSREKLGEPPKSPKMHFRNGPVKYPRPGFSEPGSPNPSWFNNKAYQDSAIQNDFQFGRNMPPEIPREASVYRASPKLYDNRSNPLSLQNQESDPFKPSNEPFAHGSPRTRSPEHIPTSPRQARYKTSSYFRASPDSLLRNNQTKPAHHNQDISNMTAPVRPPMWPSPQMPRREDDHKQSPASNQYEQHIKARQERLRAERESEIEFQTGKVLPEYVDSNVIRQRKNDFTSYPASQRPVYGPEKFQDRERPNLSTSEIREQLCRLSGSRAQIKQHLDADILPRGHDVRNIRATKDTDFSGVDDFNKYKQTGRTYNDGDGDVRLLDYVSYRDGILKKTSTINDPVTELERAYEELQMRQAEDQDYHDPRPYAASVSSSCAQSEPNIKRLSVENLRRLEELQNKITNPGLDYTKEWVTGSKTQSLSDGEDQVFSPTSPASDKWPSLASYPRKVKDDMAYRRYRSLSTGRSDGPQSLPSSRMSPTPRTDDGPDINPFKSTNFATDLSSPYRTRQRSVSPTLADASILAKPSPTSTDYLADRVTPAARAQLRSRPDKTSDKYHEDMAYKRLRKDVPPVKVEVPADVYFKMRTGMDLPYDQEKDDIADAKSVKQPLQRSKSCNSSPQQVKKEPQLAKGVARVVAALTDVGNQSVSTPDVSDRSFFEETYNEHGELFAADEKVENVATKHLPKQQTVKTVKAKREVRGQNSAGDSGYLESESDGYSSAGAELCRHTGGSEGSNDRDLTTLTDSSSSENILNDHRSGRHYKSDHTLHKSSSKSSTLHETAKQRAERIQRLKEQWFKNQGSEKQLDQTEDLSKRAHSRRSEVTIEMFGRTGKDDLQGRPPLKPVGNLTKSLPSLNAESQGSLDKRPDERTIFNSKLKAPPSLIADDVIDAQIHAAQQRERKSVDEEVQRNWQEKKSNEKIESFPVKTIHDVKEFQRSSHVSSSHPQSKTQELTDNDMDGSDKQVAPETETKSSSKVGRDFSEKSKKTVTKQPNKLSVEQETKRVDNKPGVACNTSHLEKFQREQQLIEDDDQTTIVRKKNYQSHKKTETLYTQERILPQTSSNVLSSELSEGEMTDATDVTLDALVRSNLLSPFSQDPFDFSDFEVASQASCADKPLPVSSADSFSNKPTQDQKSPSVHKRDKKKEVDPDRRRSIKELVDSFEEQLNPFLRPRTSSGSDLKPKPE